MIEPLAIGPRWRGFVRVGTGGCGRGATIPAVADATSRTDTDETDGEIARRVARGARHAEARLFERFSRRVFLYGVRHLGDEQRASDLVQDVMTLVLQKLRADEVREPDRIGSFVLGTARMMARDSWRRARRREDLAARVAAESETTYRPPEPLDTKRLGTCLEALSERERTIMLLTFHGERSAPEIAEAVGLRPGNVRVIRHRALSALQRCMGLDGGES